MTDETKEKLRAAGREDLIEIHEINQSGYAGVDRTGNIVDRRKHPDAVPVQENRLFNIPKPKKIMNLKVFAIASDGDFYAVAARTEQEAKATFHTFNEDLGADAMEVDSVTEIPSEKWPERKIVYDEVDEDTGNKIEISYEEYMLGVTSPEVFASSAWV